MTTAHNLTTQAFEMYRCSIEQKPAFFFVDMTYASEEPDEGRTVLVKAMTGTAEDGPLLTIDQFLSVIDRIENSLMSLSAQHDAVYVGQYSTQGTSTFCFYCHEDAVEEFERQLNEVDSEPFSSVFVETEVDPSWSFYYEFLLPDGPERPDEIDSSSEQNAYQI